LDGGTGGEGGGGEFGGGEARPEGGHPAVDAGHLQGEAADEEDVHGEEQHGGEHEQDAAGFAGG